MQYLSIAGSEARKLDHKDSAESVRVSAPEVVMSEEIQIALPDRFDISAAEAIHRQLEDAMSQGKPVVLQAAAVTRLDTTGVQILLAFFKEAKAAQLDVSWEEPSSTIVQVCESLQLSEHVGLGESVVGAV
jgi:phospholipid transport system transporter-binding protein